MLLFRRGNISKLLIAERLGETVLPTGRRKRSRRMLERVAAGLKDTLEKTEDTSEKTSTSPKTQDPSAARLLLSLKKWYSCHDITYTSLRYQLD
jgi:hypothetical protein